MKDRDAIFNEVSSSSAAIALDDNDADVHRILAAIAIVSNEMTRARYHQDPRLALNPKLDLVVVQMGELFTWLGQADEGADWIPRAMSSTRTIRRASGGHLAARISSAGSTPGDRGLHAHTEPRRPAARLLAASYAWLGDATAASSHVAHMRELDRELDLEKSWPHAYAREQDLLHLRKAAEGGVRTAGVKLRRPRRIDELEALCRMHWAKSGSRRGSGRRRSTPGGHPRARPTRWRRGPSADSAARPGVVPGRGSARFGKAGGSLPVAAFPRTGCQPCALAHDAAGSGSSRRQAKQRSADAWRFSRQE